MKQGMNRGAMCLALMAGACTGTVHADDRDAIVFGPERAGSFTHDPVINVARIYYNAVTGERIVTLAGDSQTSPADTGTSVSVWSTRGAPPDCAGDDAPAIFLLDNPGSSALSTQVTLLDYGDIESDTVVDCITVNWATAHPDTDTDSDSIGDGVEELAARWMLWDADNGRAVNSSTRLPLMDILFFNLPGNLFGPGFISGYTLDVDLVAGLTGTDLSFEIGDTDGDCQTAAFCNSSVDTNSDGIPDGVPIGQADRDFDSLPDSDLDGDGFFDWSWTVRFYQPGIGNDFDSDSDTGSAAPSNSDSIGISFGYPSGLYELPGGGFGVDTTVPDAGIGAEDRAVLTADDGTRGGLSFGGYRCPTIDNPFIPAAIFAIQLWGPGDGTPCPADRDGDGDVDFFDISDFIFCFQAGSIAGCDFDNDGDLDFFDVSIYLQLYQNGCGPCPGCIP